MSTSEQTRSFPRAALWTLVVVVVLGAVLGYIVLAPRATDFASGRRVSLGAYHGHDPTGVPKELATATLIERGEYLTRAADCVDAMVMYLRTVPAAPSSDLAAPRMTPASAQNEASEPLGANMRAKEIYAGACAGCHGWRGAGSVVSTANLTGTRAVNDPTAINVAQIIIHGAEHRAIRHVADMPSFDGVFSDTDIAAVANYVTAHFGVESNPLSASDIARLRAAD